jgi:hypothetical protein
VQGGEKRISFGWVGPEQGATAHCCGAPPISPPVLAAIIGGQAPALVGLDNASGYCRCERLIGIRSKVSYGGPGIIRPSRMLDGSACASCRGHASMPAFSSHAGGDARWTR